jgi:hypothetical protein
MSTRLYDRFVLKLNLIFLSIIKTCVTYYSGKYSFSKTQIETLCLKKIVETAKKLLQETSALTVVKEDTKE